RRPPGQRIEERRAERIQIAPRVDRLTARLLRAHVARGADHDPAPAPAPAPAPPTLSLAVAERDAEVGDEGALRGALAHDVVGLRVAGNGAALVGVGGRRGH